MTEDEAEREAYEWIKIVGWRRKVNGEKKWLRIASDLHGLER